MSEATTKRPKANGILKSTKETIGKYKQDYPKATIAEIARKFSVTEGQARRAIEQFEDGTLSRKVYRQPLAKIKKLTEGEGALSAEEIIDKEYHRSAAALHCATHLAPDERIISLRNLVSTGGMIAKQKLEAHMKSPDAGFIMSLYRKFVNPSLTDAEIITMYFEDLDRFKLQNTTE